MIIISRLTFRTGTFAISSMKSAISAQYSNPELLEMDFRIAIVSVKLTFPPITNSVSVLVNDCSSATPAISMNISILGFRRYTPDIIYFHIKKNHTQTIYNN